jgi:hypothetical protein
MVFSYDNIFYAVISADNSFQPAGLLMFAMRMNNAWGCPLDLFEKV